MESDFIKIEHSDRRRVFVVNIIFISFCLFPTWFSVLGIIAGFLTVSEALFVRMILIQTVLGILFIYILYINIKVNFPIYKTSFVISSEQFRIILYNKIYIQYFWRDVKKVQVSKEEFGLTNVGKYYKLRVYPKNNENIEDIRFYLLRLKKKKVRNILKGLKFYTEYLNILFVELKEVEKGISKERSAEFEKIKAFIKEPKSELKSKNKNQVKKGISEKNSKETIKPKNNLSHT